MRYSLALIAGTHSGVNMPTLLLTSLFGGPSGGERTVQSFTVGSDYLDPGHY